MDLSKIITIGGDIEVFLQNKETKEVVSAEGIIKGTKHEPFIFSEEDKHWAVSLDNVMAEFCFPPVAIAADYVKNINASLEYIKSYIPPHLDVLIVPAVEMDAKYLQTENAMLFGCEKDFNAWINMENVSPAATAGNLRSAGGHIHIGYPHSNPFLNMDIIKSLDLFLGVPLVIVEPDNKRKLLYGKAGAYRNKDYGVEYRVPSNYFITSEPLMKWVFNNTHAAFKFAAIDDGMNTVNEEEDGYRIQDAINNNDKSLAKHLIEKYKLILP